MFQVTTARALSTVNNISLDAAFVYLELVNNASNWLPAREAANALIWGRCLRRCSGEKLAADINRRVFGKSFLCIVEHSRYFLFAQKHVIKV
jgi:hypothetical protein